MAIFSGERRLPATVFRKVCDDETSSPTRETRALPGTLAAQDSLRALFEGPRLTAQKREGFAGEMEGTGDQDSFLRCPRGG